MSQERSVSFGFEPLPFVALLAILAIGFLNGRAYTLPIHPSLLHFLLGLAVVLIVAHQTWHRARESVPVARQESRPEHPGSRDAYRPLAVVPKESFADICGLESAKEELGDIVQALQDPASYSRVGARFPAGALLSGPPGTGKTMLARALAGEAGVSFFSCSGSEFVEVYAGLGATRIRGLFASARAAAPAIVFIDEFDSLGSAREYSGSASGERSQTVNEMLLQMNELGNAEDPVVVIAATNRAEVLDTALLRRGRFDRRIQTELPDRVTRQRILDHFCGKIKVDTDIDTTLIASQTTGFTGADLEALVNDAAVLAAREQAGAVLDRHFTEAVDRSLLGVSQDLATITRTDRERLAFHESGHAIALLASDEPHLFPHKVSILARQSSAAHNIVIRREDQAALSSDDLRLEIVMLLGGRAAERLHFGSVSTLCKDDLVRATHLAKAMVTEFGMSADYGPVDGSRLAGTSADEAKEVRQLLVDAERRADEVLGRHQGALERIAADLLEKETVTRSRLVALFKDS